MPPWTGKERSDRALSFGEGLGEGPESGASPLPRQKGTRRCHLGPARSGATEPFPLERVWERVLKAERHLFHDKRAPEDALLSGRGDSNTRPLRPERSALANCATSRNSIIYLTKRGLRFRKTPFVGMRRLERPTPTSLTWCANQLRHIPNRTAKIAIFSYHQIF